MDKKPRRRPGAPKTTGPGQQVVVRVHEALLGEIDDWCERQLDQPTRAEALRRLAAQALMAEKSGAQGAGVRKSGAATRSAASKKARPGRS